MADLRERVGRVRREMRQVRTHSSSPELGLGLGRAGLGLG